ncbi:MAG: type II toxin-antitoxin system VapC family toxin [Candidatus Limnocylindrales bacterium]
MVFVDSNIPMYVAGRDHPNRAPALRLLQRARSGTLELCTSTEVLQEILYRYTGMGRPDLADQVYELFVQQCAIVLPVTLADTDAARALLRAVDGLSVRDAVHAAVMLQNQVTEIATFVVGFDAVPGISRLMLD